MQRTSSVTRVASTTLPTVHGVFMLHSYIDSLDKEHVALTIGTPAADGPALVRLHSECLTGDVFGSQRCDCGEQLESSMALLQKEGRGVLLYLRQEGRGIGLSNKIKAYALQDTGLDTVEANRALGLPDDMRDYRIAADMLRDLAVSEVELLTNNPAKIASLASHGIAVVARRPLHIRPNHFNRLYLQTKQERMGHLR